MCSLKISIIFLLILKTLCVRACVRACVCVGGWILTHVLLKTRSCMNGKSKTYIHFRTYVWWKRERNKLSFDEKSHELHVPYYRAYLKTHGWVGNSWKKTGIHLENSINKLFFYTVNGYTEWNTGNGPRDSCPLPNGVITISNPRVMVSSRWPTHETWPSTTNKSLVTFLYFSSLNMVNHQLDRLCGLVVRVLGYRSGGPGSIPGTTRKKK
jgi:hypothetical protein